MLLLKETNQVYYNEAIKAILGGCLNYSLQVSKADA